MSASTTWPAMRLGTMRVACRAARTASAPRPSSCSRHEAKFVEARQSLTSSCASLRSRLEARRGGRHIVQLEADAAMHVRWRGYVRGHRHRARQPLGPRLADPPKPPAVPRPAARAPHAFATCWSLDELRADCPTRSAATTRDTTTPGSGPLLIKSWR